MSETRIEKDSLGPVEVPARAYYGAQTERARVIFPVSGLRFPRRFLSALAMIKSECAAVNAEMEIVPRRIVDAIRQAAEEVVEGKLDEHFPLDIFQTGSGTSTNMNANEVISNRAIEILGGTLGSKDTLDKQHRVHPNDHVNAVKSSNDVIATAIRVGAHLAIAHDLAPALVHL